MCSNYRGITLRSVPEKVFGIILLGRIDKALKWKIRDTQCGFSKGKSTIDAIWALRTAIEKKLEKVNSEMNIAFIDFAAAFDSVYRAGIQSLLREKGTPENLVALAMNLRSRLPPRSRRET